MTYEYKCTCNHEFEVEQSITAEAIAQCPNCKKMCNNRLISMCSFQLKGNCWAKDNYGAK